MVISVFFRNFVIHLYQSKPFHFISMSDFFKKALGVFVEFEDDDKSNNTSEARQAPSGNEKINNIPPPLPLQKAPQAYTGALSPQDLEKFTKHFSDLFDKSNFNGPDYYEFSKMMAMLETPIPDENTRISAVFATLSIQGLTKDRILETAKQYCTILENDKAQFEAAATEKANAELAGRRNKIQELEKKISDNSQLIQKLTKEITDAQTNIGELKNEIVLQDSKINTSKAGFLMAYQAMHNRITSDIHKINTVLK